MIIDFLTHHQLLSYFIVFVAMIVEGDIFLFTVAFLTHHGVFNFWLMLSVVLSGVMVGDSLWYYLGRISHRFPKAHNILTKITSRVDEHLRLKPARTLFLSKFVYNFHHAVLMRVGALKHKFWRFFRNDLKATLGWIFIIGSAGYIFSASFDLAKNYIKFLEYGILAGIAVIILVEKLIISAKIKSNI